MTIVGLRRFVPRETVRFVNRTSRFRVFGVCKSGLDHAAAIVTPTKSPYRLPYRRLMRLRICNPVRQRISERHGGVGMAYVHTQRPASQGPRITGGAFSAYT